MVMRLLLVYLVVELAALYALVSTIGFGWAVLVLAATFVVGIALAGAQARRQLTRLWSGAAARQGWQDTATDGALVAAGSVLVVVPGLVTTVAGLLLLLPVIRAVARPVLTAIAVGGLGRRAALITVATSGAQRYAARRRDDYIDAEVIDVVDDTDDSPGPDRAAAHPPRLSAG